MASTNSIAIQEASNSPHVQKFMKQITNPILQRLFLIGKLPSAFFMGIRIKSATPEEVQVTVPYGWRSQNPFKSIYFAAQAAAAEMSTGVLGQMALKGKGRVSMLIVKMEAEYTKKANKKTTFICKDGVKVFDAVARAIETGEGQTVDVESIGTQKGDNGDDVVVSRMKFTWSFKAKK